jgi:hypothetical protein
MNTNASVIKWARVLGLALMLAALAAFAFAAPSGLRAEGDNAVANGDFEGGATGWTCKSCTLSVGGPAQAGAAGQFTTTSRSARAQMFQTGITLQPNTTYELSFWGRSSDGKNVRVTLAQQVAPRTNYGIKNKVFDLTQDGQVFTYTFTTTGFAQPVSNARLLFQADKGKGVQYSIDNISLVSSDDPPPPPPSGEMLIYDWNKPITLAEGGFAMDKTSQYLGQNWVTPVNYADGRLYFRARIYTIPDSQPDMKLGFCFWQGERENCRGNDVPGVPGTDVIWDFPLHDMWKKGGKEVDWSQPRKKMGFSVRDGQNDPVSDKTSSDWGGNNPDHWYPMNLRFQVVLVPAGGTFSGWQNYP